MPNTKDKLNIKKLKSVLTCHACNLKIREWIKLSGR